MRQAPSATIESSARPTVNALLRFFSLALRAANHSSKTQETYLEAARQFLRFLAAAYTLHRQADHQALDRYMRLRAQHPETHLDALWLGRAVVNGTLPA